MLCTGNSAAHTMRAMADVLNRFMVILGMGSGQVRRSSSCEASATMAVR